MIRIAIDSVHTSNLCKCLNIRLRVVAQVGKELYHGPVGRRASGGLLGQYKKADASFAFFSGQLPRAGDTNAILASGI